MCAMAHMWKSGQLVVVSLLSPWGGLGIELRSVSLVSKHLYLLLSCWPSS